MERLIDFMLFFLGLCLKMTISVRCPFLAETVIKTRPPPTQLVGQGVSPMIYNIEIPFILS